MTLAEIIYDIRNTFKLKNDDSGISNSQFAFIINNWRARFVTQNYRKARYSDVNLVQDLGKVELELIDSAEDCTSTVGCKILRSKLEIPKFIEIDEKPLVTFVGSIQKTGPQYQIIPWSRMSMIKYQKYTGSMPYVAIKENRLYVLNKKVLDAINIQGIFENPSEVAKFKQCDGTPCYTEDSKYPIDAGMVPLIKEMIITKDLAVYERLTKDVDSDNKDAREKI